MFACHGAQLPFLNDDDYDEDQYGYCCAGAAMRGPGACTCWEPVYDLQQRELDPAEPTARTAMCADCAYRPDSPEMNGSEHHEGDPEMLLRIARTREGRFFCHQGIRRPKEWRHPDGRVRTHEGAAADYRPPMVGNVPYRANGAPAEICAGWAAHARTSR